MGGLCPQVRHAKAKRYQDPDRCANMVQLWEALPKWLQLGSELEAAAFHVPDWLKSTALEKLVPKELLDSIVGRPTELDTYPKRLAYAQAHMAHARGVPRHGSSSAAPGAGRRTGT